MRVNDEKITDNISAENVEILVESQNFMEPPNKKKKTYGRETETDKEKREKFNWTKEMVEILTRFTKGV